ncbi:Hsp33 protein [Moraxella macacae 0408225]|uniref:Hsp33 protein n=1 Tax=Moraxella macacae 0408225 TaxID=1230338 RepID=L2F6M5_9GAMM|nr:Hsp33 family molecular chaperone HslO [Moraxella macacae]ELA08078.1 Hsp33 protein [Moraxella macacae 0408225]
MSSTHSIQDLRQRFFIKNSPVRGDVVRLDDSYQAVIEQKDYPIALQKLLGEMLVAASLLIGTLKIDGRLSIQLQNSTDAKTDTDSNNTDRASQLNWAMAECDSHGFVRGLADWTGNWSGLITANDAFAKLGKGGVLFINIQSNTTQSGMQAEGYQGIVERVADNLADCLTHYQQQSVQIPTLINLACDGKQAGGILVQLLPYSEDEQEHIDNDLFPRLTVLTKTLKATELTKLPPNEILYRLYHEEEVITADPVNLSFGCTCSIQKSASAIFQLGKTQALNLVAEQGGEIGLDCGFCGQIYRFDTQAINEIFA